MALSQSREDHEDPRNRESLRVPEAQPPAGKQRAEPDSLLGPSQKLGSEWNL